MFLMVLVLILINVYFLFGSFVGKEILDAKVLFRQSKYNLMFRLIGIKKDNPKLTQKEVA